IGDRRERIPGDQVSAPPCRNCRRSDGAGQAESRRAFGPNRASRNSRGKTRRGGGMVSEGTGFLGTCNKPYAARAVAQCHACERFWCADCLVPPVSKSQPLRCVECALIAGGVRAKGMRRQRATEMNRSQKKPIGFL